MLSKRSSQAIKKKVKRVLVNLKISERIWNGVSAAAASNYSITLTIQVKKN